MKMLCIIIRTIRFSVRVANFIHHSIIDNTNLVPVYIRNIKKEEE